MNIILFLNKDLEANLAYNLLKEDLQQHRLKIYYSASVGKREAKPQELQQIECFEKEFFYGKIVETLKQKEIPTNFEFLNEDFSTCELSACTQLNSPDLIEEVKSFDPDLFISIRFGKIFKEKIIGIPRKGIINLHSALLPDYKGIMGTLHNLNEKQSEYGCSLHYIDSSKIDAGDIIALAKRPIEPGRSLLWHIVKLYPEGCKLISDALGKLTHTDRLAARKQDPSEGNYFSIPREEDFQQLAARGIAAFSPTDYRELIAEYLSPKLARELDIGE